MKTLVYAVSISVVISVSLAARVVLTDLFQDTKEEIGVKLKTAGNEAKLFGNQAARDLLVRLNEQYGKQYIKRETMIVSALSGFVTELDPVIQEGVDHLTADFHDTLDKVDQLLDTVRSLEFLKISHHKTNYQVDEIIEQGRKTTRETSIDLYSGILNIMGEYFKGFAPDSRSVELRDVPGATEGMAAVVRDTFAIVDGQTNQLLGKIDHTSGAIKNSVGEAWTLLKRVHPHTAVDHMKLLLQSVFESQLHGSSPEQRIESIENKGKPEKTKP